jgi:uncharacterized protein
MYKACSSRKWITKAIVLLFVLIVLGTFFYWQNNDVVVTKYDYTNTEIPVDFDGFKILQVSDLHNKEFGKDQEVLVSLTKKIAPDIIVVTGDLIDSNHTDIKAAMDYISQAVLIAPVYFVTGNHEIWSEQYTVLAVELVKYGVNILDNKSIILTKNGAEISLIGLPDGDVISKESETVFDSAGKIFCILLSHRPELLNEYAQENVDLVFAGHAHGGQFRIPFLGGLFAPNQGLFPKYTSGVYTNADTTMIVSRGLGNSVIPVRVFNRPELVVVTLREG